MRARRLIRSIAVPVAVLAVLSASCSSERDDSGPANSDGPLDVAVTKSGDAGTTVPPISATSDPGDTEGMTTTAVAGGGAVSDFGASEDSRLLTIFYVLSGLGTADEDTWALSSGPSETAIGECMSSAGFQYSPGSGGVQLQPSQSMPREEFAARFGFGVTMYALDLIPPVDDPNADYTSSLSPAEQIAFGDTLKSCLDAAPSGNPDAVLEPGGSAAVTVVSEQFRDVVANDERVLGALVDWQECLNSAGFDFENPDAMRSSFYDRMVDMSQGELEALHDEEVIVATANVPCEAPYTEAVRQVVADRFGEFKSLYESALSTGATPDANG